VLIIHKETADHRHFFVTLYIKLLMVWQATLRQQQQKQFKQLPMTIRLFTSGTHKSMNGTLSFSNEDVDRIYDGTQKIDLQQIPFVLGHPKNNLPIVGWLKKTAIQKYTEGDKVSLGFNREKAELSDESMNVIRDLKSNKISVRLENGAIRHIGLVTKAAIEENNAQDFSQADLTGVFHTSEDILEKQQNDFSKFLSELKTIFKPNFNMAEEKKENQPAVDLSALVEQNRKLAEQVTTLTGLVTGMVGKTKATADFMAEEYKNMTAVQKETAATIMADLGDEKATALKILLKELAKAPVVVRQGSVVKDLGAPGDDDKLQTVGDIVREQMKNA
jgi:hypothetical protein